ncbi:uncharacterized protein LOC141753442 isoform X2 [Sebastes fasciatus]|uniref:uncharacterized protein LOC141753442 isoform X2 n=1 Tax=Sebastes fasciatus TaxID=394691 RepID=UPI003D9FADB4
MTEVRNSLTRTQFDAIAEVVSAESFHIVLETNPPDYVEKISHYLESCVGQSGQENVSNGPAEADSDSGDSLFITQKPVPEAERSGRQRTYSSRSKPVSPRDLEESEEDTSSSTSHDEESKTDKKRRRIKKYKLPTYNFPFLAERKLKLRSTGLPDQNKNLLNYTMGGFFKCVRELRLEPKSSLPTVDTDGEDISPLSEEDEDRSEVEDIKVVERKQLVEILSPSKAKRQQTRSTSLNQQRKRKASNAGQKTTRGRQTKALHKDTVKASASKVVALSSVTESSDEGESSCRAPVQSERKDQHATRDGNFLAQTETPKRKGCLVRGDALSLRKASEEDSDATVCELPNWQSTQNGREASTPVTEPQTDAGNETEEKKKKDKEHHESVEEEVVAVSAVTESSDDGESSCRALVQSERKDQHATSDGNFLAQTETPKRKGCLVRGGALSLRKASEEDSDATVCELPRRQSTQNGREAATPVTEPQTDVGNETEEKRKKDKEHHESVEAEVVAVSSVTECSDNGESSCRALVQRERKDQHATSDGNFLAQTETPKRKGCLVRRDTLSLRKASEEDSDATVCELPRKQSTQNGREASTPVTEPQTDAANETKEKMGKKKKKDKEHHESVEAEVVAVASVTECSENGESSCRALVQRERKDQHAGNETKERKRKKKKKEKEHHESVEEGKGQSQEEPDNVLRQEEGDIPDSKQKKKKRKKDKSATESVGQEVDGSLESDVRVEDSNMEDGGKEKKKKKKKKRKRSGEDVEQLQSGAAVAGPLNDDAEIQKKKKKKRKKEEMIVITEEREEEEAANRTLGSPQMSTEQFEESGNCLENAAASQETLDSRYVKRKKNKKKRQSSSNDATQDGEEGKDVSVCLDDSVTWAKGTSLKQKKKKTIFEWVNGSNTPDENEKVDNTPEGFEDQNAELVTKKKKKKRKSEIFSRAISEDKVVQSDDSVSVREKKKERTSSFLVADAEENDARAHGEAEKPDVSAGDLEELNDGVMKKKKKKKMSVAQDSVEKDREQDFEESKKSALPEITDARVKKQKKRTGSGSEEERLDADAGLSPTEEAVVLKKKKKKKKKCKDEQEGPPTASEDVESVALNSFSSVSHKKKGEHGRSAEISHDSSTTSDRASKETLNAVELGHQALNDLRDKKKKKKRKSTDNVSLEGNSLTESAELKSREIKKKGKKERNKQSTVPSIISETSLSKFEMSSSDNIMKIKHKKVKRSLHNPSEEFLSDC